MNLYSRFPTMVPLLCTNNPLYCLTQIRIDVGKLRKSVHKTYEKVLKAILLKLKLQSVEETQHFATFKQQLHRLIRTLQEQYTDDLLSSSQNQINQKTTHIPVNSSDQNHTSVPSKTELVTIDRDSSKSIADHGCLGYERNAEQDTAFRADSIDLNIVDETQLAEAKRQMDVQFKKNSKRFGDEGFVYDVVVDFGTDNLDGKIGEWDSEED